MAIVRHILIAAVCSVVCTCSLVAWADVQSTVVTDAGPRDYILWYRNYDDPAIRALVTLALNKTPEYGPFRLLRSKELSQALMLRELTNDHSELIDIANVATSVERESYLTAIRIPIDGGLLGLRVCVVLKDKLPLFRGIKTLEDFRNRGIRIGQEVYWPDTPVLELNGVTVATHARHEILFGMLKNDRFDCFAHSVTDVMRDMTLNNDPETEIEPNLLLAYPMPNYLFVRRDDIVTAHRLQLGLERAISDSSFNAHLIRYYAPALEMLNLDRRTIIALDNPYLTEESLEVGRGAIMDLRQRLEVFAR